MKKQAFSGMVLLVSLGFLLSLAPVKASDLVQDCTTCGCPSGQYCDTVTKTCKVGCAQGVYANSCFPSAKPSYCDSQGRTINNCLTCGCPAGQDCMQDGSCGATPVLTATVSSEYNYNTLIEIYVQTLNIGYGQDIQGRIYPASGNPIPQQSYSWTGTSTVKFTFAGISSPGTYIFKAYYVRDPMPTVWSTAYTFSVKAPLTVDFLVTDPNQYTVQDISLTLTIKSPTGEVIQTAKTLTGTLNGMPIALHEIYIDKGAGSFTVVIPKTDLRSGIMDLTIVVTDPSGRYQAITKTVRNIQITAPEVSVGISAPETAAVGNLKTISIGTNDVYGKPLDVDSLSLRISYPDGVTFKQVETLSFRHTKTGVYETDFTFLQGGAYSFHAVATKELYNSGANSPDPITVVSGGGPGQTCDVSSQCDPNCPDDPDCQSKTTAFPLWMIAGIGGILLFLIIGVVMIRRKKR